MTTHLPQVAPGPGCIRFVLARPTPLLNGLARLHWSARLKAAREIGGLVRLATQGQRPLAPFPRAHVMIERHSLQLPDHDNLVGGVKALVDSLLPPGNPYLTGRKDGPKRWVLPHPTGLSIITDDNPACLALIVLARQVRKRAEQCTVVTISPW